MNVILVHSTYRHISAIYVRDFRVVTTRIQLQVKYVGLISVIVFCTHRHQDGHMCGRNLSMVNMK
jgi:hypothetical protein